MSNPQRLLLVVSPLMHRTPAYERAAALAKAKDLALHIVAFDYLEGLATAGLVNAQALAEMREGYVERHRLWLEEQAGSMRRAGLTVTTEVVWVEHVVEEIQIHLNEQPFELLIKDIEHESRLKRALFTTLDVQLLRECAVPLHFVCNTRHALPKKIIAAVDLSHPEEQYQGFNDRIITEALKLAIQCKAQVELIYAYDFSSMITVEQGYGRGSFIFASNLAETLHEAQRDAFNEVAERNGIPAQNRHLIIGAPAKVLINFAEANDIDVIVMGRVHRQGLAKHLGSTVENILYKMPSSVLVIMPERLDT